MRKGFTSLGTQHRAWGPRQGYLYWEMPTLPTREATCEAGQYLNTLRTFVLVHSSFCLRIPMHGEKLIMSQIAMQSRLQQNLNLKEFTTEERTSDVSQASTASRQPSPSKKHR